MGVLCSTMLKARHASSQYPLAFISLFYFFIKAGKNQRKLFPQNRLIGLTFPSILAGSEITAYNFSWTIYYFQKHPGCLSRLQEEIDKAALRDKLSYPPSFSELLKFNYFEGVIKEGLRYATVNQMHMERVIPKGDMEIFGYHVPEGITVGCIARVIHLNKFTAKMRINFSPKDGSNQVLNS